MQLKYATGDVFNFEAQMGFGNNTYCRATKSRAGNGSLAIDVGEKVSGSVLTCKLGAYTVHENTGVR